MSQICWLPDFVLITPKQRITLYLLLMFFQNALQNDGLRDFGYQNNENRNYTNSNNNNSKINSHLEAASELIRTNAVFHPEESRLISDTHRLVKRMDLESCLGHFDVHKNTIIRTGESQAIGGKYLQGLELSTPYECQRLCCETERCDVYIFEEKHDGYCYLFECGPSENFHCKFTRHANYTSAVLIPVYHAADTTSTSTTTTTTTTTTPSPHRAVHLNANISQQERELTSLKSKSSTLAKEVKGVSGAASKAVLDLGLNAKLPGGNVIVDGIPSPVVNYPSAIPKAVIYNTTTTLCGRFQFACHSGECIAVYNACDGIPQCEDGSDEGPECSGAAAFSGVTTTKSNPDRNAQNLDASEQKLVNGVQIQKQTEHIQQQPLPAPILNNREDADAWVNRKMVVDSQQNVVGNLTEINSHIFNHKGGIQVPTNGIGTYSNANQNTAYAPPLQHNSITLSQNFQPNYRTVAATPVDQQFVQQQGHVAVRPDVILQPSIYQQQLQSNFAYAVNTQAELMMEQPSQQQISNQNINMPVPVNAFPNPDGMVQQVSSLNTTTISRQEKVEAKDENLKEQFSEPSKKEQYTAQKSTPTISKEPFELGLLQQLQHLASPSPVHEQNEIRHEKLSSEFREHDGLSDRPGGAVLSLTMGLIITVALAILIGCRLRTVGRRSRRLGGKTPYSHEADFLVNGMYL